MRLGESESCMRRWEGGMLLGFVSGSMLVLTCATVLLTSVSSSILSISSLDGHQTETPATIKGRPVVGR